jgi:putative oxidoreductase
MAMSRTMLRLLVGGLFVGHGTQKLFGWFDGRGVQGTAEVFESAGLRPGRIQATAAGTAETLGGAALAAGLFLPAATSALSAVMITAIRTVHWSKGPWSTNGGYEFPAVMLGALFALAEAGPDRLSVDHARRREHRGARWALAALVAGAIGSQVAITLGRKAGTTTGSAVLARLHLAEPHRMPEAA